MKRRLTPARRAILLAGLVLLLLGLFFRSAWNTGPMAPVPVTIAAVEPRDMKPAIFGIGTVEARFTHRIGPNVNGRIQHVDVDVGDRVRAGQVLGGMDPVDFDARIAGQESAIARGSASVAAAQAQAEESAARAEHGAAQAARYEELWQARVVSAEEVEARRRDARMAQAAYVAIRAQQEAASQDLARLQSDLQALRERRDDLVFVSPIDGWVTQRNMDSGTTVLAGQAVLEVVDPASLWVHVRVDQSRARGLRAGLPAEIVLRSRDGAPLRGHVARVEPRADVVTEELLAKVVFDDIPDPVPSIGELAEVTLELAAVHAELAVPNASVQRVDGSLGVWRVESGRLCFAPVVTGIEDLDGHVQVTAGLEPDARIVVHSLRAIRAASRIRETDRIPGVRP